MLRQTISSGPAQTVGRAVDLLRLVASSKSREMRLVDLAEMARLDRSTAHRLLQRLVLERLLTKGPKRGEYRLGPLLHELGLAALPESGLRELAHDALLQLAQSTGDSVFLVARSGFDTVCVERVSGKFVIETMTEGIGDRHPLGLGAGGLSILSALGDAELERVLASVEPRLRRYQVSETLLRQRVLETRERGYALGHGSGALDVTAVGRCIRNPSGVPSAAVFVAAVSDRTGDARLRQIDKLLLSSVRRIETAQAKARLR